MVYHYEARDLTSQGLKLSGIIPVLDEALFLLSINDDSYLNELKSLYQNEGDTSMILDILGSLFGLNRQITVTYEEEGITVTEELYLDDKDFLTYIKCQIIKNNYNGNYQQFKSYYDLAGLTIGVQTRNTIESTSNNSTVYVNLPDAAVKLYLINTVGSDADISDNLYKLFISGKLTLSSMGIQYIYDKVNLNDILVWSGDSSEGYNTWGDYDNEGSVIIAGGNWL